MFKLKRLILLPFFIFILSCQKKDKIADPPAVTDFSKLYSVTSHYDPKSTELVVGIKLDPSLHAYAQGEKVGKPVRLELKQEHGWAADGAPDIPKGQKKKLGVLGESVVLQGNIILKQKLKPGTGPGEAMLYLQVCTENTCDRPRIHILNFK